MVQIRWTPRSIKDAIAIKNYISEDSIKYAEITIRKIKAKTTILKKYIRIGRIVPEFNTEEIRELIEGNYRIIYRIVSENQVDIITIYHSSRDLNLLKFDK